MLRGYMLHGYIGRAGANFAKHKMDAFMFTGYDKFRLHVRIYHYCTRASWTWHTKQVTDVKTPKDWLKDLIRLSDDGWTSEIETILTGA